MRRRIVVSVLVTAVACAGDRGGQPAVPDWTGRAYELAITGVSPAAPRPAGCGALASWLRIPGGSTWLMIDTLRECSASGEPLEPRIRSDSGPFGWEGHVGADSLALYVDTTGVLSVAWIARFDSGDMTFREPRTGATRLYRYRGLVRKGGGR